MFHRLSVCIVLGITVSGPGALLRAQEVPHSWGFVTTNGTKLYYEEAGSGPPVVLVHGGWLNSRQWDHQMALLSRDYRVIRYDCRGSGRSVIGDSTYAHDDDLAALLAHLHIDRAQLVGVSAGAQIAIDFTLNHPASVTSLMVGSSPLSGFDTGPEFRAGMIGVMTAGVADDLELEHQRIWDFGPFRVASGMPEVRKWLDEMILHEYTWVLNRPTSPKPRRAPTPPGTRLGEIKVPVLVVVGTGEMPGLVNEAEFVAHTVVGAEIVRVKDAGHFPNIEQPEQFDDILTKWLKRAKP
jgi:3-oxoadipate enol-lactonase